jgi:tRNA-2-methylthio-N6-dimethylallyladenosine synthase
MVTIIEGCNKRCTFCIVPTTRGPERCRTMERILAEVRHLVAQGFVEIELLGQTVNHWRQPGEPEGPGFADLLDAVARVPGVARLRFVTSYPRDFTPAMVAAVGRHPNICPYLHLPVQSGSDRVLRRMGRGYAIADYHRLVADLRRTRPGIAISTDIIVGFPGESEEDFAATLELVREVRFSSVFAFRYSPRPGVAALRLPELPVGKEAASERLQRLFAAQTVVQRELNEELVGRTLPVLITGPSKQPGVFHGRTTCHRIVHFPVAAGESPAGRIVDVEVTRANDHSLMGERCDRPASAPGEESFRRPLALLS